VTFRCQMRPAECGASSCRPQTGTGLMERAMGIEPTFETWENTKPQAPSGYSLEETQFTGRFPASVPKKCSGKSLSNISNNWIGLRPVAPSADET
jgi:hypothetical protein